MLSNIRTQPRHFSTRPSRRNLITSPDIHLVRIISNLSPGPKSLKRDKVQSVGFDPLSGQKKVLTMFSRSIQSAGTPRARKKKPQTPPTLPTQAQHLVQRHYVMCQKIIHCYSCGDKVVNLAPCAECRGNNGRCPRAIREIQVVHEEACDKCDKS